MEQIEVTIAPDGSLSYVVKGVKGKKCKDLTKAIDEMSDKVLDTRTTPEFNEAENKNLQGR